MMELILLAMLAGAPEKVAIADAVVAVRAAARPALPNSLKKTEPLGQPTPAPVIEVQIQPAPVPKRTEGPEVVVTVYVSHPCEPCDRAMGEAKRGKGIRKIAWIVRDFDLPKHVESVPFYEWDANGKRWSLAGYHTREEIEAAIKRTEQVKR